MAASVSPITHRVIANTKHASFLSVCPDSGRHARRGDTLSCFPESLPCNAIRTILAAMSMDLIEGLTWFVERRWPERDIVLTDVVSDDGSEHLIRISGLSLPADYLSAAAAREFAGALIAAADELARRG
jgi:hypothetical protein